MSDLAEANEDPDFRQHMDEQAAKRRPEPRLPSPEPRTFEDWKHVPDYLKPRSRWLRLGRKVKPKEAAVARKVTPYILGDDEPLGDFEVLDSSDGLTRVTSKPTELFRESQTTPYTPTPRTEAYWAFEDIFLYGANTKNWLYRSISDSGEESDCWATEEVKGDCGLQYDPRYLTPARVRTHLNHGKIVGIKNKSGTTKFLTLDLDYHLRDREVFLEQARVLLEHFHGDTWHYQVSKEDVSGMHFFKVFPKPRNLNEAVGEIEQTLQQLDDQNPELRERAKKAGMKSLAEMEIYPAAEQGIRLPLARGRWMILDGYVGTTTVKNRKVADIERYVAWLNDPNRKHMPVEDILQYLQTFTFDAETQRCRKEADNPQAGRTAPRTKDKWKNRQRQNFVDFWINGEANGISLNEHIVVLARTAWAYGYSETEAAVQLTKMVRQLPGKAAASSRRLTKQQWSLIDDVIRYSCRYAYRANSRQKDVASSTRKLKEIAAHYRHIGFDPLKPASWSQTKPVARKSVITWNEQQRKRLTAFLRSPLKAQNDALIMPFVEGVIQLAARMSGRQWGHRYFLTWAKAEHPEIKLGCDSKRLAVLKVLQEEGILQLLRVGTKRTGCSEWSLGPVALAATGADSQNVTGISPESSEDLGQGHSLQGVKARPSTKAQLYAGSEALGHEYYPYLTQPILTPPLQASIYIGCYSEITPPTNNPLTPVTASGLDPP